MKTKGISIWERHVEHLVVGVAFLVLIGFAVMQFLGNPNAVEVPGTGKVGPGQVDTLLEAQAASIADKIIGPGLDLPQPKPVTETFNTVLASSINPQPNLPVVAYGVMPNPIRGGTAPGSPFVVPEIAAPYELLTHQYFDTLSAETVAEYEDLKSSLPAAAPYDITWITAACMFDLGAVRKQFGQPGPKGEAPLPLLWYNNRVDFIDVKIEREELQDGKWVNATVLEPIPGQVTVRPMLKQSIDAAARDEIRWIVSPEQGRDSLIHPEFYSGAAAAWVPPDKEEETIAPESAIAEDNALVNLKKQLARLEKSRDRIAAKMKELACSEDAPPDPPKGGTGTAGGGSRGGGGGGGELGSGGGSMGLREKGERENEAECKKLRPQLKKLKEKIANVQAAIEKLAPPEPEQPPPPVQPEKDDQPDALPDQIMIWGHDINVQSGKTYRYRFTIEIYNPLFLRKHELIPEQQAMSEKFTLASKTSEWSAPRLAEPPLRFFVTSARTAAQSTGVMGVRFGSANVEVYRFRDGRWWRGQFNNVQPGDRIGGSKAQTKTGDKQVIDYGTDWFMLDVVGDVAPDRNDMDRAWAATVLLQSLSDPTLTVHRQPKRDSVDPERQFLRQEVDSAEAGGSVASK